MKTKLGVLTLLTISMTLLILGATSSLAAAQVAAPCTATLSYPTIPAQYGNSNTPLVVPVSASCTAYSGSQLYATGSAYDTTANAGLGSANTVLPTVNGGTEFNGQLGFNLPPTQQGDAVQISVSIYDSQGGNLLTTTGETVQLGTALQQVQQVATVTSTVTQIQPNADPPTAYQPNQFQIQSQNQHQWSQAHYQSQSFARSNNTNLLGYAVIIAIIATVIIATAGLLLLVPRRQQPQPVWYPVPPPS